MKEIEIVGCPFDGASADIAGSLSNGDYVALNPIPGRMRSMSFHK
jgi:hypothetical protein